MTALRDTIAKAIWEADNRIEFQPQEWHYRQADFVIEALINQYKNGYPNEMINAGQDYLNKCVFALHPEFNLPAIFNWHEFFHTVFKSMK